MTADASADSPTSADIVAAAVLAVVTGTVLFVYHRTPNVDEALHYYKENDRRMFVSMRICYVVIVTAAIFNARYLLSWAAGHAWTRARRHFASPRSS